MATPVLVLDNGCDTIKAGLSTDSTCKLYPNCVSKSKKEKRRVFVSRQIDELQDLSSVFYLRPSRHGYVIDMDLQVKLWDYVFGETGINCEDSSILLTDSLLTLPSSFNTVNEMLFEEYNFTSVYRCNPSWLSNYWYRHAHPGEICCLIVDCGYSSSAVIPYLKESRVAMEAIRRLPIGGKLLTNYLKDVVSYRQVNVMNETHVINQVKEDVCFVTLNIESDLADARLPLSASHISCDYVLPDFSSTSRGYICPKDQGRSGVTPADQVLRLTNERFRVPEILFHPSDVGIQRQGVVEMLVDAISTFPLDVQPHMWRNILVTGGSTLFRNFRERFEFECRSLAPEVMRVRVSSCEDAVRQAWRGGALLARNKEHMEQLSVSRAEYAEHGNNLCAERFNTVLHPS